MQPVRRVLFNMLFVSLAWLAAAPVSAAAHCEANGPQGQVFCRAALPERMVAAMSLTQERSNWCWAAALSMVAAGYGHAVAQATVAEHLWGAPRNLPINARDFAALLNRDWFDATGRRLAVRTEPAAMQPAVEPGNLALMLASLGQGRPIVLAVRGHVVVLAALLYEPPAAPGGAPRILEATVLDPLPGEGLRVLAPGDLEHALVARVDVEARPDRPFVSVRELFAKDLERGRPLAAVTAAGEMAGDRFSGQAGR